ncbi:VRR-NUC domain-containing protein [Rudanella paleaurantiibacter]|uniref:phosphodiesterase I n=1 Tax=Rudanella paleaurantiibacter TaxID=2614655 RepID=A0A7J5U4K4_9BACT|nr:VRR-NUC domain-containing protein [Rudanella paleaurantiibacter]KAB7732772.1 VRR-NUC domain-containing protein [Rudanella paleaurantiibacter]
MLGRQKTPLTPRYYLHNFRYVLDFVKRLYGSLLNEAETDFVARFSALSEDAQCLFVRFSNRKGLFFRVNKLQYTEITDLPAALTELLQTGFVERLSTHHEVMGQEALSVFTKPELLSLLPLEPEELKPLRAQKKEEVTAYALHELNFGEVVTSLTTFETVVKMRFEAEVTMFKYLFFGNRSSDMTEFVIRDLGMVNFERYDESKLTARFRSRKEVEDKLLISLTGEAFYDLKQAETPAEDIYNWFLNWNETRPELSEIAIPGYQRLVCKVGGFLERHKLPDQALAVYELSDRVPARERRVRLLFRNGLMDEALALCDEIAVTPQNAEERYFANDFRDKILGLSEKKRSRKTTTRFLSDAESVSVPAAYRHHVENGVMNYYLEQDFDAAFTENYPWRGLFGLVFWDIIYDANVSAIHHPLQRAPSDFYLPDFYLRRAELLRKRLTELETPDDWRRHVGRMFNAKYGITNVLVDWNDELLHLVNQIITVLDVEQLRLILLEMARNVREHTRGFPDLLIWNEAGQYEFVEVKSPTDHLGPQQLHWLQFFQTIGVRAKVVRVIWEA